MQQHPATSQGKLDESLAAHQEQPENVRVKSFPVSVCEHLMEQNTPSATQDFGVCAVGPEYQPCRRQHKSSWAWSLLWREKFRTEKLLVNVLWVHGPLCCPSSQHLLYPHWPSMPQQTREIFSVPILARLSSHGLHLWNKDTSSHSSSSPSSLSHGFNATLGTGLSSSGSKDGHLSCSIVLKQEMSAEKPLLSAHRLMTWDRWDPFWSECNPHWNNQQFGHPKIILLNNSC